MIIKKNPLSRLILGTLSSFFAYQVLLFTLLALLFRIRAQRLVEFLISAFFYHVFLVVSLNLVQREFVLESTGETLERLNWPLFLSFLRLSSVPTVLFILLEIKRIPILPIIVPYLCLIFLTDFFDGILARKLKQTTKVGKILDSSGDYFLIIAVSILFYLYALVPGWLFTLILIRMAIQIPGMVILYGISGYSSLAVTFLGKASIFASMGLYAFELFDYLKLPLLGNRGLIVFLEYATGVIVILSLVDKVIYLVKSFRSLKHRGKRVS